MYGFEKGSWFPGEVSELHEDIFLVLGIEDFPIDILDDGELFVKRVFIVALEIGIEDEFAFFHKERTFLTVDELPDMLFGFRCLDK